MNEYDDGLVACTDTELVIRRYDMLLRPKRIRYGQIRSVEQIAMNERRRWRIWGSGDFVHWFNLDAGRPKKRLALVLDLGGHWQPVITPDDPERVASILRSHDVAVAAAA